MESVFMACSIIAAIVAAILLFRGASMVITYQWQLSESSEGAGIGTNQAVTKTGDGIISVTAITGPANKEILVGWDSDTIQALILLSTVDCNVYTNAASTGSPDDTVPLKANEPLVWTRDSGVDFPFTGGAGGVVSKIYVTNAAAAAGTLKIRGIEDVTP